MHKKKLLSLLMALSLIISPVNSYAITLEDSTSSNFNTGMIGEGELPHTVKVCGFD